MKLKSAEAIDTKFLDGVRFLLALWVALGHFYFTLGGAAFIKIPLISPLLYSNSVAVDGFIVITGFLMAYHYIMRSQEEPPTQKRTVLCFWLRRLFRLYPLYFIAVLSAFFLSQTTSWEIHQISTYFSGSSLTPWGIERSVQSASLSELATHLLFIHGLIPSHVSSLLGPAWSLSLEAQFYFLFPLIFLAFFSSRDVISSRFVGLLTVAIAVGIISPKLFGLYLQPGLLTHFGLPSVLIYKFPLFLVGMVAAAIALHRMQYRYLLFVFLPLIVLETKLTSLLIVVLLLLLFLNQSESLLGSIPFKVLRAIRSVLSSKLAALGGDLSYSLYLNHMILMPLVIWQVISMSPRFGIADKFTVALISLASSLVVCHIVAHVCYVFIEKPFIRLGKGVIKRILLEREIGSSAEDASFAKRLKA